MAREFDDLAADAAAGLDPEPRCTGREMASHLIISRARIPSVADLCRHDREDLPAHENDHDWDGPLDYLFQDHDVLTSFWPQPVRDGVTLDPEDWFVPFEPEPTRDPGRGIRSCPKVESDRL